MKRALLIGINYFGTNAELRGCHNDIRDVRAMLECSGYEIKTLLDHPDDPDYKLPDCPTADNIIAAMNELVTGPGDQLYLHYSGHGTWLRDTNLDEPDGRDEVICALDYQILDDELNAILVQQLRPGVKLRAVFDCCFSGSVLDLPVRLDVKIHRENYDSAEFVKGGVAKDVIMISGCTDKQTSADAFIGGIRETDVQASWRGALTWAFLESLPGTKSWRALHNKIRKHLAGRFPQLPQLSATRPELFNSSVDIA